MREFLHKDVIKDEIRRYFKNKAERDIYTVDVVDTNAELQKIFDEALGDDVAPVKRGKWSEKETLLDIYYDCSICGESFCFIEGDPIQNQYKYCPNCGATMDGDRNA